MGDDECRTDLVAPRTAARGQATGRAARALVANLTLGSAIFEKIAERSESPAMKLFRRAGGAAADLEDGGVYFDERLRGETRQLRRSTDRGWLLKLAFFLAACWALGLYEVVCAVFTHVDCMPRSVPAGGTVTCELGTLAVAAERQLSLAPTGAAGSITLVASEPHRYIISFATAAAGRAGVRVQHSLVHTSDEVEVMSGPAVGNATSVRCEPRRAPPGSLVRCAIGVRDSYGNAAEVVRPLGAPPSYFAVSRLGAAGEITVQDAHVEFTVVADSAEASAAGVSVTLEGVTRSDAVDVARDQPDQSK